MREFLRLPMALLWLLIGVYIFLECRKDERVKDQAFIGGGLFVLIALVQAFYATSIGYQTMFETLRIICLLAIVIWGWMISKRLRAPSAEQADPPENPGSE